MLERFLTVILHRKSTARHRLQNTLTSYIRYISNNKVYKDLINPFIYLQKMIRSIDILYVGYVYDKETLNAVLSRIKHSSYYVKYYKIHLKCPPMTFCQYLRNILFRQSNPHNFDYYMEETDRNNYVFPNLFILSNSYSRNSHGISILLFINQ